MEQSINEIKLDNTILKWYSLIIVVVILSIIFKSNEDPKIEVAQSTLQPVLNIISTDDIYTKVAIDAEKQYEIVARNGDKNEMFVYAGTCVAAWLSAKNEVNYKKWKEIEAKNKKSLGL
jgi:hypothetical protein